MGVQIGVRAGNGRSRLKDGRQGGLWMDDRGFLPLVSRFTRFWVGVGMKGLGDNGHLMMMLEGLGWWQFDDRSNGEVVVWFCIGLG